MSGRSEVSIRNTITLAAHIGFLFDAYVINIYGVTLALIAAEFHDDLRTMGIVGSIFVAGYAIGSFAFGMLGDKYGRKISFGASIVAYGLITTLTGFSQNILQFSIGRFLTGVGGGGELTVGVPYVVEIWPKGRRTLGTALMFIGYGIGLFLATVMAKFMIGRFGWRSLYWAAFVPAIIILIFRLKLDESPRHVSVMATLRNREAKRTGFFRALRNPKIAKSLIWGSLVYVSITSIYYAQAFYEVTYMKQQFGMALSEAVNVISLFNGGLIIFAAAGGLAADKFGRRPVGLTALTAVAISIWFMYTTDSSTQYVALGILVFGGIGASWAVGMAHVAELFPTEIRGSGYGWSVAIGRVPSIFAPVLVAYIATATPGGIGAAMKWSFIVLFFAMAAYLFGPETLDKEIEDMHERPSRDLDGLRQWAISGDLGNTSR